MLILTLRTDKPEAEIGLYDSELQLEKFTWLAHKQLSLTIHTQIADLLERRSNQLADIKGVVIFQGPGSFTGLRIGISLANALAYSLGIPIVASQGDNWTDTGLLRLIKGDDDKQVIPEYGSEPHTTLPRK